MNWGSWQEFWSMGGHGAYVWGAYGVVVLVIVVEAASVVSRLARVRRKHQRRAAAQDQHRGN